jgi:D-tagatose-1,6-bisphosphate aldolase subunit GatZ/KbaZ
MNYLDSILQAQKLGEPRGIASICSAHPFVIEATLQHGLEHNTPVLVEATCNQVNQFGGYTGLTPAGFVHFVGEIASRVGFPSQRLILGGDHLGPLVWADQPAESAMLHAKTMLRAYALAGFGKIHLDCSVPCADDHDLSQEQMAQRAAELATVVELACDEAGLPSPRYIIGTEVPTPGGARAGEKHITVTNVADAAETIGLTRQAFYAAGLQPAWERVIALVVQPGVEFGDARIHEYDRLAATGLVHFIEGYPRLIYEAHSTDYQTYPALRALVEDHFAILKVGPGLTFAFREAVFALAEIEEALAEAENSRIRETIEAAMLSNPVHWQKHYRGSPQQQKLARQYSFSDRIRYYWATPGVQAALARLLRSFGDQPLPLSLLSQYLPVQYARIRQNRLTNHARSILLDRVGDVLEDYHAACNEAGQEIT